METPWLHKTNKGRVVYDKKKKRPVERNAVKRWIKGWVENRIERATLHNYTFNQSQLVVNQLIQALGDELAVIIEEILIAKVQEYGIKDFELFFLIEGMKSAYNTNPFEDLDALTGVFTDIISP